MARKAAARTKADSTTADPTDSATATDPITSPAVKGAEATTTRERILEIALDLFIRKGYAATSMREIASPLGISKAALYYHFPSKAHLMLELHLQMHRAMADLHDIPAPGADDTVWLGFVEQLIGLALRNRRIIEFHFRNRDVFEKLEAVSGRSIDVIHIIGGGSENALLNQMTANATGKPVVAGPVEATVIGNALMQFIALGEIRDLHEARGLVSQLKSMKHYEPHHSAEWEAAFDRYKKL
jgi:AcrR family transcriptional regulator